MKTKHTKLPWNTSDSIIYADGKEIANCEAVMGIETEREGEANAKFIILACNAYEDLVNALKFINHAEYGYCICPLENGVADDEKHSTSCANVRKALAKAGVK